MTEVLKDVLIAAGDIERYYEDAPSNLWRACRTGANSTLFGLVEEDKILSSGQTRPADITIVSRNGIKWVRCSLVPRGISTFDRPHTFHGTSWEYYKIPQGTKLPIGLAIVKDSYNRRLDATHYTIAPAYDMPLVQFKKLLDELALLIRKEAA